MDEKNQYPPFALSIDRFIGWLKKPFDRKPGFFLHQLLGLFLIFECVRMIWPSAKQLYRIFFRDYYRFDELFVFEFATLALNLLIAFFFISQIWFFYKKTNFAWTAFMALLLLWVIRYCMANLFLFNAEYIFGTFARTSPRNIWVYLNSIPYIAIITLEIYLMTRKKILVMHRVNYRNSIRALGYAILFFVLPMVIPPIIFFFSAIK